MYLIVEFGRRGISWRNTRGMLSKDSGDDIEQAGLLVCWSPSSGTAGSGELSRLHLLWEDASCLLGLGWAAPFLRLHLH